MYLSETHREESLREWEMADKVKQYISCGGMSSSVKRYKSSNVSTVISVAAEKH
jgi:hypothetical protein